MGSSTMGWFADIVAAVESSIEEVAGDFEIVDGD